MGLIKKAIISSFSNEKGFTLLEMLIASSIFIIILFQIGNVWEAMDKWLLDLIERSNIDREARIARDFLISDLVITKNVTLGPFYGWELHLDGNGAPLAQYWQDQDMLIRRGNSPQETFPVTRYLSNSDFRIGADESATAFLDFQGTNSNASIDVFMKKINLGE